MALRLELAGQAPAGITKSQLTAVMTAINQQLGSTVPEGAINLKFVDDFGIQALNKSYGHNDHATDVLSFSYIEDGSKPVEGELGDVAISTETAQRQAKTAGTDVVTEISLLVIHGCLHILGYDHQTSAQIQALDQLQHELMNKLNLTYRDFQWDSSKA